METQRRWRSASAVRTMLLGALVSVLAAVAFFAAYAFNSSDSSTNADGPSRTQVASFTTADAGACLTWDIGDGGLVEDFDQTGCDEPHRFEVSTRIDLASFPASEFDDDAPMPDVTRQAQLREDLCLAPTLSYLDGRLDPTGRFSVAPILPPQSAWDEGDRTMLCGLQSPDDDGTAVETTGPVSEQDQARVRAAGTCVSVGSSRALREVDCAEDHQIEFTEVIDLLPIFPEGTPSTEDQDHELQNRCTQAAMDFLGGEEQLYRSTLEPYWTTISPESWEGGSRSVNCGLVKAREDSTFATLHGSAKGPDLLIDGNPPAEKPERAPLREEDKPE